MDKRTAKREAWRIVKSLITADLDDYESDYMGGDDGDDRTEDRYTQDYGKDADKVRAAMDEVLAEIAKHAS